MNPTNTILLADKDEELLEVLQLFLDRMGYYVVRVNSAKDLISNLQTNPAPVILTSFHLPDMAGIELIKTARDLSPQTEIIIMVDEDDFDSGVISLKFNVSDFITKPIKSDILEVLLERAFRRRKDRLQIQEYKKNLDAAERNKVQFQQLFDEVPCYISIQDRNFRLTGSNKLFRQNFGDHIGSHCYEVYKHRTEPCRVCPVADTFEDGANHQTEEVVTTQKGEQHNVLTWTCPLRNGDGEILQVMEMSTDTTQLRHLQSRLTSLGLMIGSMSHNIRGILTGLDGGLYRLEKGLEKDKKDQVDDALDIVKGLAGRIKCMVLDMLYYTKDRALNIEDIDLLTFSRQVADIIRPKANRHNVKLICDFDTSAGTVEMDVESVNSCLINILDNSIDACLEDKSRKEEYSVNFSLHGEKDHIVFKISDNGVGIDQETREKIFTLFFSSKGNRGTGFGLFISNQICEQHGGSIIVNSTPGKGSVFQITLPRIIPDDKRNAWCRDVDEI
jgi:signal transduction histidine kinase/DNA-binding response OmpR family regulator